VSAEDVERRILELWMTTRIPLTRANLQFLTGAPRKKLEGWLEQMVVADVLDADVDDRGEIVYSVRGADRSPSGPATIAELERLDKARRSARSTLAEKAAAKAGAMVLSQKLGETALASPGPARKSLAGSAILSFVLGPIGWLYAGPWKTAVPAAAGTAAAWMILPHFLLAPFYGIALPASAAIGALYAWRFNRHGKRTPILPEEKK
jgi:hypothetical protein